MEIHAHGGGCCGAWHIRRMGNNPLTRLVEPRTHIGGGGSEFSGTYQQRLHEIVADFERTQLMPRLLEVTLTDSQDRSWITTMREEGFQKVGRYFNGNTSNYVNVWWRYNGTFGGNAHTLEIFDPNQQIPPLPPPDAARNTQGQERNPAADTPVGTQLVYRSGHGHDFDGRNVAFVRMNGPNAIVIFEGRRSEWSARNLWYTPNQNQAPAPRQERRELFETYHCLYRDGRRGAGYTTEEEAFSANPRVRQVQKKAYHSDGTTTWDEPVIQRPT